MTTVSALASRFLPCIPILTSFNDEQWFRSVSWKNPFLTKLLLAMVFHCSIVILTKMSWVSRPKCISKPEQVWTESWKALSVGDASELGASGTGGEESFQEQTPGTSFQGGGCWNLGSYALGRGAIVTWAGWRQGLRHHSRPFESKTLWFSVINLLLCILIGLIMAFSMFPSPPPSCAPVRGAYRSIDILPVATPLKKMSLPPQQLLTAFRSLGSPSHPLHSSVCWDCVHYSQRQPWTCEPPSPASQTLGLEESINYTQHKKICLLAQKEQPVKRGLHFDLPALWLSLFKLLSFLSLKKETNSVPLPSPTSHSTLLAVTHTFTIRIYSLSILGGIPEVLSLCWIFFPAWENLLFFKTSFCSG